MSEDEWPSDWLRGVLSVAVLAVIDREPTYGYAIAAALEDAGFGAVKGGTLYPLLTRLQTAGLVAVAWRTGASGPARKYYSLTPAGAQEYRRASAQWARFADLTTRFVTPPAEEPPA